MKEITANMIQVYNLEALGYDFMGYTFDKTRELSFHHLIIPKKDSRKKGIGDGYVWWNGAILKRDTAHDYLHRIEQIDRETFLWISDMMVLENVNKKIDKETLLRIREYLVNFEAKHANDVNEYGKRLIKQEFITNRIPL